MRGRRAAGFTPAVRRTAGVNPAARSPLTTHHSPLTTLLCPDRPRKNNEKSCVPGRTCLHCPLPWQTSTPSPTASPIRIKECLMARRSNRRQFLQQTALAGAGVWVTGVVSDLYGDNPPSRARRAPTTASTSASSAPAGKGPATGATLRARGQGTTQWREHRRPVRRGRPPGQATPTSASRRPPSYSDFRVMLERERNLDAVIVSTPDHTHCHGQRHGHAAGQALLLREAADPRRLRSPPDEAGGPRDGAWPRRWATWAPATTASGAASR